MATNKIGEYLDAARGRLECCTQMAVVLGNEAADLDSMASALAYARLLFHQSTDVSSSAIPLMNIPRNDFKLRTEVVRFFGDLGIDDRKLLFVDEVNLDLLTRRTRIRLVLVDHNVLAPHQTTLAPLIDEIVDHHKDAGLYPKSRARTIEPVGSTATLIADRINATIPALLDTQLATLLLGTILLDTANLDVKRTHEKDRAAVRFLERIVETAPAVLFEKLESAKFNPGSLGTCDLLRKDYKEYQTGNLRYAISSVPMSTAAWMARDTRIRNEVREYSAERQLNALITMQFYKAPDFTRELGLYSADPGLRRKLLDALAAADLQLQPIAKVPSNPEDADAIEFFTQGNTKLARKDIQGVFDQMK